jgi:hypothetical protein
VLRVNDSGPLKPPPPEEKKKAKADKSDTGSEENK